ncbi:sigma factor [Actinocorallia sp. B10E7]|uniref:RNA polymerase sigma factor n=1 Tax=Actinocorallia sp. B10E7 TaxID=3153558 RepID=UPI00325E4A87
MPRWSAFAPEIDRGLVAGLNDGEENALAKLYDTYVEQIFDYAVSLSGEGKAAEALVHDVFIDAARRGPRLRDRERFRAWLYAAVRRRGMERSRARGLVWDWGIPGVGGLGGLSVEEARELLEGALDRVSLSDQDLLLLTFRHGVVAADLAAVLGVSPFKAAALAGQAKARAEAALEAQLRVKEKRCLRARGGRAPELQEHRRRCPECRRRAGVPLSVLLEAPPAPVPPPQLRHRVLHTGTDPELAGYRADISGKGGNLTPEGLPRQPDVPSPLGRRWLLAGGGMLTTFVVALITSFLIGPNLGLPTLPWPPGGDQTEMPVVTKPTSPVEEDGRPKSVGPLGPGGMHLSTSSPPTQVAEDLPGPQDTPQGTPSPSGSPPPSSAASPSPSPQPSGHSSPQDENQPQPPPAVTVVPELRVDTPLVEIGSDRTTQIQLQALGGSVPWQAVADSSKITLDSSGGTLGDGQGFALRVRLPLSLVRLAGSAVVSIINMADGTQTQVTVRWGLSVL